MIPVLSAESARIAELCRRFHVRRLDLFGSAAREADFSGDSDIDLLVTYQPGYSPPPLSDFLALRDALAALTGRQIDLVMDSAIRNPFLRRDIERSRVPLHGA